MACSVLTYLTILEIQMGKTDFLCEQGLVICIYIIHIIYICFSVIIYVCYNVILVSQLNALNIEIK